MRNFFLRLPRAVKVLIVALVYFVLAVASLEYSYRFSNATPIWPPSGFAFAVLLLAGRTVAPGIFIGAFSANLFVFLNNHVCPPLTASWSSAIIGMGNTAEALTGWFLLQKLLAAFKPEEIFKRVHAVLRFVFTAFVMCLTSCTIGATTILLAGIITPPDYFMVWFTWWTGDVSGVILVTPFIVLCLSIWRLLLPPPRKLIEAIFLISAIVVISIIVFFRWLQPPFLFTRSFIIFPFLIWASVRLNRQLLAVLLMTSALIAVTGTLQRLGPFIAPTLNESLLTLEAFISVNCIMVLVLSAAISEREEKEQYLQLAKFNLEEIVRQRTRQLEEKNRELQARNKELASFTYAASHDLQEPLRKIQTFSDKILQTAPELSKGQQDLFRRIQSAVMRMKSLIENLLSYSRVEASKPVFEPTDMNSILQEVKNDLSEAIQNTGAVIDHGNLPQLSVVPFQLQQLLTNIISNAIKFRKENTAPEIIIESALIKGKDIPEFSGPPETQFYHLCISDNGIGFEQQYAEKIFDIFQRLHGQSEYEGTGIGLAICKKIVATHNGFITASGELGKGASFNVFLPLREKEKTVSFQKETINTSLMDEAL